MFVGEASASGEKGFVGELVGDPINLPASGEAR
jgi:hypothetical protein